MSLLVMVHFEVESSPATWTNNRLHVIIIQWLERVYRFMIGR